MGEAFNQDVRTALNLYESMIKPILTYASDFWGCLKLPKNNPIEVFHMKVLKQILGVQKQTTNLGVLLELGKTTLDLECIKLGVKNWERIKKGNANTLLKASYKDATVEELPWISGIRLNLEKNGLLSLFLDEYPDKPPFIGKNPTKIWLTNSTKQPLKIFGQKEANLEHMHYSNQKLELNPISPRSEM